MNDAGIKTSKVTWSGDAFFVENASYEIGAKVIEKGEPLFIRLDKDEEIEYIKEGMKNG